MIAVTPGFRIVIRSGLRQRMRLRLPFVLAVLLGVSFGAAADRPTARLTYTRKAGSTICPDEPLMRQLVAARLGYDPFRDDADRTVVVTISTRGRPASDTSPGPLGPTGDRCDPHAHVSATAANTVGRTGRRSHDAISRLDLPVRTWRSD